MRDQIVNLNYMLAKSHIKSRPFVLWCYCDKLEISSYLAAAPSPRSGVASRWGPPVSLLLSSLIARAVRLVVVRDAL
uniref:Uncharacterized protein n=1 Tax=Oryza punctata TaxID=4537 RepID=A0A0E0LNW9_ORYPU